MSEAAKKMERFLKSEPFRARSERYLKALTGNYKNKLFFKETDQPVEQDRVVVNPNDERYEPLELMERIIGVRGKIANRSFHQTFSDLSAARGLAAEYGSGSLEHQVAQNLFTSIEGAAVDLAGCSEFPGLTPYIKLINEASFKTSPELQTAEAIGNELEALEAAVWQYANLGTVKGEFSDPQLASDFEELKPMIDSARRARNTRDRVNATKQIVEKTKRVIERARRSGHTGHFTNPRGDILGDNPARGEGRAMPDELLDFRTTSSSSRSASEGGHSAGSGSSATPPISEEEMERIREELEQEISDIHEEIARDEEDAKEGKSKERETANDLESLSFDRTHQSIRLSHTRSFGKRNSDEYAQVERELHTLIRTLSKKLQNMLKYNLEEKRTGQVSGFLTQSQLWRQDGKIFSQRRDKNNESDLAITVLVDESGSMGSGRRAYWAQRAAIMITEVCQKLAIPISIIGHDAQFGSPVCQLRHYVSFEKDVQSQKENLVEITARQDNRDGMAYRYAGEYLIRQPHKDKLFIVIADGEPAHGYDRYHGHHAVEDCRKTIENLAKQGVVSFGVAIGDGQEELQTMFPNFVSVPRLELLPQKLVSMMEKKLLKTAE